MNLCNYGCGLEAKHQLKNGKWCCSKTTNSCIEVRIKNSKNRLGKNLNNIWKRHFLKS